MAATNDIPPFVGYVQTTTNALRLIHAARQGVIPRITRRLNDHERRTMIRSGSVFVFSVEESGIRRWTDGRLWSPSRIVGNFLVYREINERSGARSPGQKKIYPIDEPASSRYANPDIPTFKAGGLHKKTITVTIDGTDLHLISYYTNEDIRSGVLKRPTARSDIMDLRLSPHMFRLTNFRIPPKMEIGPDGKSRIAPEPEDLQESSSQTLVKEESESPEYTGDSPSSSGSESQSPTQTYPLSPAFQLQYPSSPSPSSPATSRMYTPSYTTTSPSSPSYSRDRSFSLTGTYIPPRSNSTSLQRRETMSSCYPATSSSPFTASSYDPRQQYIQVKVEDNSSSGLNGMYNPTQQQYSRARGYDATVPRSSSHQRSYGHPYAQAQTTGYTSPPQWQSQQQVNYKYDVQPTTDYHSNGGGYQGYA